MDTADNCLAVRNNVGFVAGSELADSHDNSNMFGGNRGLRETLREGGLESPENGFNLNCSTTSDREDPNMRKQTGPVRVYRLSRVPGKEVRADCFTINETLGLPERPAWDRRGLPRESVQNISPGGGVGFLMSLSGWAMPKPMIEVVDFATRTFVVNDPTM